MAIFIIAIGAAEAALALSIVIAMYREKNTIEFSETIEIGKKMWIDYKEVENLITAEMWKSS